MINYVGVNSTTGKIESGWWESNTDTLATDGSQGDIYVEITNTVSQDALWIDGAWIEPTVSIEELRVIRDRLLAESDWTATIDYPGADQALWLTYRQVLRDMTDGYVSVPAGDIVWPVAPQ